ncbi:MAG: SDR family oxidoreductase [Planctomycetes bacterium]|nr:SDR family oxidoreductase [Planctomycetota bacterium]
MQPASRAVGGSTSAPPLPRRPLALVTGASMGIGAELARVLAERGHDLVLTARSEDLLRELSSELEVLGARTHVLPLDLAAEGAVAVLVAWLHEQGLEVDVLVNNAGFGTHGPTLEAPSERERAMLQLLVQVPVDLTRALVPAMRARGSGRILQVASTASFQPCPGYALYAASKSALLSWSNALHHELRGSGVTCTTLCPGPTATAFLATAGHRPSGLQRRTMMTARRVAELGVRGMERGRPTTIPGLFNRLGALLATRLPRTWATATAGALLRNRD